MKAEQIRKAAPEDLPEILRIYSRARAFMAAQGNGGQWGSSYPEEALLKSDIEKGNLYVLETESGLHGVFAFILGEDPTYGVIEDGQWLSGDPYGTIHRIAGDGSVKGLLGKAVAYAEGVISHLRIDTHENNKVMRRLIPRYGFSRRGIIHLENGSPRIAYEKL